MKTINTIHISARLWFQKTYGNTYHSVTVYVNDENLRCDYAYGYGDSFFQTAEQLLREAGYNVPKNMESLYLRESLNGTYNVVHVSRKKDLKS